MKKPNLLILGAQKAGTSWLHSVLKHHPDIFMSEEKEISWFNQPQRIYEGLHPEEYFKHFSSAEGSTFAGESTPAYFWTGKQNPTKIPERVIELLGPDVRFIVILRCPLQRAFSAYRHHFLKGRIPSGQSLCDTPSALGILDIGQYERHLRAWERVFANQNILVTNYDELKADPVAFVDDVLSWLRLPISWNGRVGVFDLMKKVHVTSDVASRMGMEGDGIPEVSETEMARLIEYFEPGVRALECRLGWTLDDWLQPPVR